MTGKGDTYRKVDTQQFHKNWERIFGTQSKKERPRELVGNEHTESNFSFEWKATNFQEGSVRYAEYSIQYHAPTTDH